MRRVAERTATEGGGTAGGADALSVSAGPQRPSSAKLGFRPDVEGLRAVAVLAVVLFHAAVPGVGGGFVGVDVFFVISGFLITGLLWREVSTAGTVRLRRFYGARARRLLPASATVGVLTAVASGFLLPPLQVPAVMGDGIASALYVSNYWFILQLQNYFDPGLPTPFEHYWSLGVEEQFYFVWPALIIGTAWLVRLARRRTKSDAASSTRPFFVVLTVIAAVSFAMSLAATYLVPSVAFFSLPTRAWQLAVGGLVALTVTQWHRLPATFAAIAGWSGLALIVLACTAFSKITPYPGTAALLPTLGTALVIGAGCSASATGCGRVLSWSPMQAIGRVSYSWYLWHWPVLLFAPLLMGHSLGLAGRLVAVLVSGGLAVITLHLVENPLRFAAPLRRSPARSLAVGGVATAAAVSVCAAVAVAIPPPVGRGAPAAPLTFTAASPPTGRTIEAYDAAISGALAQVQAVVAAAAEVKTVPSNLDPTLTDAADEPKDMIIDGCLRTFFEVGQPDCAAGDTTSATTVALLGDSNATMWSPAFDEVATQKGWRLETLTKSGCPPMDLAVTGPVRRLLYTNCEQWRDEIITQLNAKRPRLVVMSVWRGYGGPELGWQPGFASYDPAWMAGLTRLVRQLRGTGAEVLVLGPIPDPHSMVAICLSGHLDDTTACSAPRSMAVNEAGIAAESAAIRVGGGHYVDVTGLFCTADRCPVIVGNTLVYSDQTHVTAAYSRLLSSVVGLLAERALAPS
ncbi:acyltransferase family protein [Mycobacterium sp. NPDC051804]|uniref:acyltransferase family protein n=1 Tax=Mycobacterium sp. NPDC051804 TaxID=3364295 RepID=UPI00378A9B00